MYKSTFFIILLVGLFILSLNLNAFPMEGTGMTELTTGRNANTRVWQTAKMVDSLNPSDESISKVTVTSNIYEKADGLNYNAGTDHNSNWQLQ